MGVGWARFEIGKGPDLYENARITHWQHFGHKVSKMHLIDVALQYSEVSSCIPQADAYVFEELEVGGFDRRHKYLKTQQLQAVAVLTGLLSIRNLDASRLNDSGSNVYFMERRTSGRYVPKFIKRSFHFQTLSFSSVFYVSVSIQIVWNTCGQRDQLNEIRRTEINQSRREGERLHY